MTELADVQVRKTALLTPRNLKALLDDLRLEPGVYPTSELYAGYLTLCEEADAEPISKKAFGMSLANQGCTSTTKRISGKEHRAWLLPRRVFRDVVMEEARQDFSPDSRHPTLANPSGT